jgi:hypothetical protein
MADRIDDLTDRVQTLEEKVDKGFKAMDAGFVEQREYTEFSQAQLRVDFSRVERKLDQFIDTQSQTNALVERRLKAREQRHRRP